MRNCFLIALLMCAGNIQADLIYKIDANQNIGVDSAPVSGFVIWDESLLSITTWHIETGGGVGVHGIFTEGAVFDSNGVNDAIIGGELLQTLYTTAPSTELHEFEIAWSASPVDGSIVSEWSIKETWTRPGYPGTHWRTGSISTSLVSAVPLPSAAWLFGSGLIGLIGLARRKANA